MSVVIDPERLRRCYHRARELLLAERTPGHYWVGELSTSALSTATAVMALLQVRNAISGQRSGVSDPFSAVRLDQPSLNVLISRGLQWLITHQNSDGGWGDTVKSFSNISTTMLCHATLVAAESPESRVQCPVQEGQGPRPNDDPPSTLDTGHSTLDTAISPAQRYIDRAGGVPALVARYGKDKTFSIPILTHCALAGLVDWKRITPLPFELACLPAKFYKTVRLPVVSYALPALIAIGQVRHHFAPTWNPLTRFLRNRAIEPSLRVLERIQPTNGGFLEATPLTSFVTMSLAAKGLVEHTVVQKGVQFLVDSVRPDGSWPIDTNLSTWVTTLAVNALGDDLPEESRIPLLNWLLDQQYQEVHPYTNADPGGWAWTNLPGGVPDADDTPGAMLALLQLTKSPQSSVQCPEPPTKSPADASAGTPRTESQSLPTPPPPRSQTHGGERTLSESPLLRMPENLRHRVDDALRAGTKWLLGLQNRDGGFPTFCRGWGTLPFDRSSPDITAHALRAVVADAEKELGIRLHYGHKLGWSTGDPGLDRHASVIRGYSYLIRQQREDGSWLPLWFGNQHAQAENNPTYGTARVLPAFRELNALPLEVAQRGMEWLRTNQNSDGGWGAGPGTPSSVEETALAIEALLDDPQSAEHLSRGLEWLMQRVEAADDRESSGPVAAHRSGAAPRTILDPAPIGFYFAKLWYFERLYPLIFAVSCLRRAVKSFTDPGDRRA